VTAIEARKIRDGVIGTLVSGRFRLEEQIGSGGMSTVYRAFDQTLERLVAIKLMHADLSRDPAQLERFRRESRAAARLSHPNLVTVIDAGEDDGHPYIVFEYVDGETLKSRIRRDGPLPPAEAVAYAIEIGRALAAAHGERIVHRDVKPQNVLLDPEGRAKVTDFGIARSLEAEGLTATGRVLGTTDYVSPEQALGEPVTEQSDVYSLGVVLFEMLTGSVPFKADSQVAVAMKHVQQPMPDVQQLRPEVSAALAQIVDRATAKELENRYATMGELVAELEHVLGIEIARAGESTGEATAVLRALDDDTADFVPLRLRRPRRWLVTLLLVATAVAVGVGVLASQTEEGRTGGAAPRVQNGLHAVRLAGVNDYDPFGRDGESAGQVRNAIDGNRATVWDTEDYSPGGGLNKPGVGLYVETESPVAAERLRVVSSLPGWDAEVYAANEVPDSIEGWERVAGPTRVKATTTIRLDPRGQRYRYWLVWIVELPEEAQAAILELTLQARR
jgi:eukaryotic-like serine/threonine-protein kinase